jgi:hypothetical protein
MRLLNALGKRGVSYQKNRVREIDENLSGKNLLTRWHLAPGLLRHRHEDGVVGMDRNCGDLRQMGRLLDCQNWPLATVATDGVAKIIGTT